MATAETSETCGGSHSHPRHGAGEETCGGALDMRVARAGHDKIPLARIERRVSLGARPEASPGSAASEEREYKGECYCEELSEPVSVIQHYQQTGLC